MIIGFTGTRRGMTGAQKFTVGEILSTADGLAFTRHGDCVGADVEFDYLCGVRSINVIAHPSDIPGTQGGSEQRHADLPYYFHAMPPLPAFVRNYNIVSGCDILLATPAGFHEEQRSGTWYTIRLARRSGVPVVIVWPDGSYVVEEKT